MNTLVLDTQPRVDEAREILNVIACDSQPAIEVKVGSVPGGIIRLSPDLSKIIWTVVRELAEGATVSISSVPEELSTTEAARMMGISRPTLMKKIREGALASHKVGTHNRVMREDVLALKEHEERKRQKAFSSLRSLQDSPKGIKTGE